MTKSRPALSVKRKRMEEMLACATKQYEDLRTDRQNLQYSHDFYVGANERLQTRLTAALAEAEGLREKIERDTQRTIAENDRHGKQYVQKFREWEALVETEAKLGAEIEALDASRLEQANTLKALREELKLAKKDATDWAMNHEKEKRRADGLALRPNWLEVFLIAGLAVLGMSFAGYWHGKHGADRWYAAHPRIDTFYEECVFVNSQYECNATVAIGDWQTQRSWNSQGRKP